MKLIQTAEWKPSDPFETYQVYNGLDCCLTFEIFEALQPQAGPIYDFERALQGPALEMSLRGLRVDPFERDTAIQHLEKQQARLSWIINRYADAIWGKPLNPASHVQKKSIFYDHMQLPPQYKRNTKGERTPTVDRSALEKLEIYFYARPLIRACLAHADVSKQLSTLRSEVDPDHRMRTSYNIAGTETWRWSSSANALGTGTNLQNITDKLRRIFVADPGRKLANLDLEQAESRLVGIICFKLFGATNYIDACESSDLHTAVSKLVWPSLPWTGRDKDDRKIAERPFYRDFSYRDMAKRGGHGTNYVGTDYTMAKHLKVERPIITEFQRNYFAAFPEIPAWHKNRHQLLTTTSQLTTLLGATRHFFGRAHDDTTFREFVAFEPQSVVGMLLNLALHRIWKVSPALNVRVLAQIHDAILLDYPDNLTPDCELELLNGLKSLMETPLTITSPAGVSRTFIIPSDASCGWNWGKFNDDPKKGGLNIAGLRKARPEDRTRPKARGLDRVVPDFH